MKRQYFSRKHIVLLMSSDSSRLFGASLFVSSAGMLLSYRLLFTRNVGRVARTLNTTSVTSNASNSKVSKAVHKAPATTAKDCDTCACEDKPNDMMGSVKNYDRHVVICVPPGSDGEWLNDIGLQAETFPYSLNRNIETLVKAAKKAAKSAEGSAGTTIEPKKALSVKVTAMVLAPEDPVVAKSAKILVYPDNLAFDLFPEQVSSFADLVMQPLPLRDLPELENFTHSAPWFGCKKLLLVCVHNARDKRCGTMGPELIAYLDACLKEPEIMYSDDSSATLTNSNSDMAFVSSPTKKVGDFAIVRGSSHIGGHVYAGTMIVCPEGRWYGRVSKQNVPALLKSLGENKVYNECLRGCTSSDVLQW